MASASLAPDGTRDGYLSPWQAALTYAYHQTVKHIAEHLGEEPSTLLGERVDVWIAGRMTLQGGGHPSQRALRKGWDEETNCSAHTFANT